MDPIQFAQPYTFDEEAEAAADVVRSHWLVGGAKLADFETRFAEICGAPHGVGVSSWTTGAFLVLHAWGIGPGDEVIVPSYTFIASVNVVRHVGATPVFVDIDPQTWNLDPGDIERHITPKTRAIVAVDQLGLPCDMDTISQIAERYGLLILDDAACGFGSFNRGRPVGSLTDTTVFSLHARKVITTGEGGMIVTFDDALASRLRLLRHQGMSLSDFQRHGQAPTQFETYPEIGYNFRITDLQAAIGLVQLDRLDEILARRRHIASRYNAALAASPHIQLPLEPGDLQSNWQSYMIGLLPSAPIDRDALLGALFTRGIPTRRSVMACHLEAPYREPRVSLPHSERAFQRNLLLPMHPGLSDEQVDFISATVLDCLSDQPA